MEVVSERNPFDEPSVVKAMRGFKKDLLDEEESQMREMARRWRDVEDALAGEIDALASEIDAIRQSGGMVSPEMLWKLERYRKLLMQAGSEFRKYADWADRSIREWQENKIEEAIEQAIEAIQMVGRENGGIEIVFDRLPVEAVEYMVGLAGDGKPLGELLRLRMVLDGNGNLLPGVQERLTQTLIRATAMGWNPRKTARMLKDDLAEGLQKALVIARTEQLRVFREASRAQYEMSRVVEGHKRLAAHDSRVCAACLADDGRIYPVTVAIPDHPQGRCTSVPVIRGLPDVNWLAGEEWLRIQDKEMQEMILGGLFEGWNKGEFRLKDVLVATVDPVWGAGLRVASAAEMRG